MMKKSPLLTGLGVSCATSLCFAFSQPVLAANASHVTVSATVVNNMPWHGKHVGALSNVSTTANSNVRPSIVTISDVALKGSSLKISGSAVDGSGSYLPFALAGKLYKGANNRSFDGRIYGSMTDTSGHFKVLRFEIVDNPSQGIMESAAAKHASKPYLAIYLEKTGTRDMTLVEVPANKLLGQTTFATIQASSASYPTAPKKDVFWIEKMFLPDTVTHGMIQHSIPKRSTTNITVRPMAVYQTANWPYYSETYYTFGYTVTDSIYLEELVTYPSKTSQGTITGQLAVIGTSFDESNGTYLNMTAWKIGGSGPAGVKLTVPQNSSQRIQWESDAGQIEKSGSWSINFSYGLSWYGFGASLAYHHGGQSPLNQGNVDPNGAYEADFYTQSGEYLSSDGDYISVNWEAPQYAANGGPMYVTDRVDFIYNLYNSLQNGNGTNYGTKDNYLLFQTYAD